MEWLTKIREWFTTKLIFTHDCRDTKTNIEKSLKEQFPSAYIEISDARMYFILISEMKQFLAFNLFRFRKWTKDEYDCEQFAFSLKALVGQWNGQHTFGIVCVIMEDGKKHALNCMLDEFGKFWYVEPQNNKIFQTDKYHPYLIWI